MLVVRAPVRVSFGGGGTDLPAYYAGRGGMVLSTTISKYIYVIARPRSAPDVQIMAADLRTFWRGRPADEWTPDAPLSLPRAVLSHFGIEQGVELTIAGEVLPGTGLGSSSACAVAVGAAALLIKGAPINPRQLAEAACYVEIERLGSPIGRQDQYAAAFGGLNEIRFSAAGVTIAPLRLPAAVQTAINAHMLLFFTGQSRAAAMVLAEQQAASRAGAPVVIEALDAIKALGEQLRAVLLRGDMAAFGALLDQGWQHKRRISSRMSSPMIDAAYAAARAAGALGGKVTGAGGGGFVLLWVPPRAHGAVQAAVAPFGLQQLDAALEPDGVQLVGGGWPAPYL